ncbi:MAG: TIGR04086 family membrane protein [Clostridia bacterium]|nr:TIGR04086 family membrane protein [Clostridia bacterium]
MIDTKNSSGILSVFKPILWGVLAGAVVTVIFMFLFAAVLTFSDMSDSAAAVMSMISLAVGSLAAGFVASKLFGKNGLFVGVATGAVLFIIVMIVSMLLSSTGFTIQSVIKLVLTLISGAVGGVAGVNLKKRKKII